MTALLYKHGYDEARDRLTRWWNGEDIGRPALMVLAAREKPVEGIPEIPEPEGWTGRYSTRSFEYRVHLAQRACVSLHYLAEAIPAVSPDLAPNTLALYLGCKGLEQPKTVWVEPCIESPETARFELDPANFYWDFTMRLAKEQLRLGAGKFLTEFPDLIEGLDTLAAMRDSEKMLIDLIERPEWVQDCLKQITERYFEAYDRLYDLIKDDRGGSVFWAWAPGRMSKLQCDISAMISPAMFGEFMVPVLKAMTEHLDYSIYHWDGPGALKHHDHLLSLPRLNAIQWNPGAGRPPVADPQWWPYYHKTFEAGKRIHLRHVKDIEAFKAMKKEFGSKMKNFLLHARFPALAQAEEFIAVLSD